MASSSFMRFFTSWKECRFAYTFMPGRQMRSRLPVWSGCEWVSSTCTFSGERPSEAKAFRRAASQSGWLNPTSMMVVVPSSSKMKYELMTCSGLLGSGTRTRYRSSRMRTGSPKAALE